MTTHNLQRMSLPEFHQHIAECYEAATKYEYYAQAKREDSKRLKQAGLSTAFADKYADLQSRVAHRLRNWARKQVTIKYQTL